MDKLKHTFTNISNKLQNSQQSHHHQKQHHQPSFQDPRHISSASRRLAWPPKLLSQPHILGEVKDTSGRPYARDLGRSIQLSGNTYYMFGDTFCFNSAGDFCGVTNNTIARVPDPSNPTKSQWLSPEAKVPEFVPLSPEEAEYGKRHSERGENKRFVNWAFGGVVEIPGSSGREAWLFYDTVEVHDANPVKQHGIGLAKATVTDLFTGAIACERASPFPLFDPDGPAWGNISNIAASDGWTYLLTGRDLDNYMARIRTDADFSKTENYGFLHKGPGGQGYEWKPIYNTKGPFGPFGELAHDVLHGQGQGAIIHVPNHSPEGKPYLWFGCSKFPMSELFVGCAATPEGPWEVHSVGEMPKVKGDQSKTRYCIYPHPWGSKFDDGKVLISWSDDGTMGGKVITGYFSFALA